VKGYAAALGIFGAGSFGNTIDSDGTTGGTDQRLLVSVRRDQNQRFRRAVLLDAPTSHGTALPAGKWHGTSFPTQSEIYRSWCGRAKAGSASIGIDVE
jgi:hypothetical protein